MVSKALATPAPLARSLARCTAAWATGWSGLNGSRSVWVSITSGATPPDRVGQPLDHPFVHLQGVVAELPALEIGPYRPGGLLGLLMPDPLHVLDRLARLVPKVPGLAALAVRERHHPRLTTSRGPGSDRARGPPHEVARVRPHDQQLPAAATGLAHLPTPSFLFVPRAP